MLLLTLCSGKPPFQIQEEMGTSSSNVTVSNLSAVQDPNTSPAQGIDVPTPNELESQSGNRYFFLKETTCILPVTLQ